MFLYGRAIWNLHSKEENRPCPVMHVWHVACAASPWSKHPLPLSGLLSHTCSTRIHPTCLCPTIFFSSSSLFLLHGHGLPPSTSSSAHLNQSSTVPSTPPLSFSPFQIETSSQSKGNFGSFQRRLKPDSKDRRSHVGRKAAKFSREGDGALSARVRLARAHTRSRRRLRCARRRKVCHEKESWTKKERSARRGRTPGG